MKIRDNIHDEKFLSKAFLIFDKEYRWLMD